ncbi:MAG: hypothetical protein DRI57_05490 [Deltaproteobacteria bacterium]|nr:MAG: hypothetical protein DRI57_05490 [Deltaproteobacteria bacterium]
MKIEMAVKMAIRYNKSVSKTVIQAEADKIWKGEKLEPVPEDVKTVLCGFPEESETFQVCPACGSERVNV